MGDFKFHVTSENPQGRFKVKVKCCSYKIGKTKVISLKKNKSVCIKFKNTSVDLAYMNWDTNDPDDTNKGLRHHLKDLPGTFDEDNKTFTLTQEGADKLSWKVTYKPKGIGDDKVTVTFGEDAP